MTTRTCGWCKEPADSAVEVGLIERNSLPALAIYACGPCVSTHRIKRITEHTGSFDGQPQYWTDQEKDPRDAATSGGAAHQPKRS